MTNSTNLLNCQKEAVASGVATRSIFADRALNAELWDVDGKRYVDFASGIAVNNTGHRHPAIMKAVAEQAQRFTHTCFNVAPFEGYIRLAERLNKIVPTGEENLSILVTTGAEAVENAVKIARAYTGRPAIIAFAGAFHGRTLLGMALTGKVMPYKKGFGPFPADVFHAPFPNPYLGFSTQDALAALERIFQADVEPDRVAAFIVEPVQGEGGFNVAPPEFLIGLREIANRHGVLIISDEVQAGMGRTGRMFGCDHAGIKPDIVTMAKGLGGGFPISAVTAKAEIMRAVHVGGLGGTYAGNPLSVAAANAVLDIIEDEKLCDRATEIGRRMTERLESLASRQGMDRIGDIRGLGAMVAMEIVDDRETKTASPIITNRIVAEAEARGLILLTCGTRLNVIRLLAPLTIEWEVLEEGLCILEASIEAAFSHEASVAA